MCRRGRWGGSDRADPRRFDLVTSAANFVNPHGSAATRLAIDSPRFVLIASTETEYLALQGASDTKHELVNGAILAMAHLYASVQGRADARREDRFLVRHASDGSSEMVVLAIYGDVLVEAPLNRERQSIRPEFRVSEVKAAGAMKLEAVGPLSVK